jgi:Uri superfamily endonuclease/ADP-ribose pyrophosphatase YjhB (NUDIX family)
MIPDLPGAYALILNLSREEEIVVGRLGRFEFPAGWYVYLGSARGPGGLAARLARHRRSAKSLHWHVDYLRAQARPVGAWYVVGDERKECSWAEALSSLEGASLPAEGFGASDCHCPAHLVHFKRLPTREEIARAVAEPVIEVTFDKMEERDTVRYTAAGGVVTQGEQVLVLLRPSRDEVRLPKGHIEPGESARATALRETREESGYRELSVEADLGTQRVTFDHRGRHYVRTERYFLMALADGARSDGGEQQFEPSWLPWDEALAALTFEAEREWVRRAKRHHHRTTNEFAKQT